MANDLDSWGDRAARNFMRDLKILIILIVAGLMWLYRHGEDPGMVMAPIQRQPQPQVVQTPAPAPTLQANGSYLPDPGPPSTSLPPPPPK
jgi:hypothetical protein